MVFFVGESTFYNMRPPGGEDKKQSGSRSVSEILNIQLFEYFFAGVFRECACKRAHVKSSVRKSPHVGKMFLCFNI